MVETAFQKLDKLSKVDNSLLFRLSAPLWNIVGWRKFIKVNVIMGAVLWAILGFDSTVGQIIPVSLDITAPSLVTSLPSFIIGKISFTQLIADTQACYGLGTHWSAVVIYGLFFVLLSKYYERIGIKKSENLVLSLFFTIFSIGIFELGWMWSYATFQNQSWVFGFKHAPFLMNIAFLMIGVLTIIYVLSSPYKFNLNKKLLSLSLLSIGMWIFWVNYPFSVTPFSATILETGKVWHNTNNFPQTMYTVDLYPSDSLLAGFAYHVKDDLVHFINTGTKVVITCAFFCFSKIKLNKGEYSSNIIMEG